ncbi:MAG: DUF3560 domain-containing protein, partial [Zoogloeaceae bacterium]|nr:DUF3560 domain-containing protein [Zoogloeaceae bacterium]
MRRAGAARVSPSGSSRLRGTLRALLPPCPSAHPGGGNNTRAKHPPENPHHGQPTAGRLALNAPSPSCRPRAAEPPNRSPGWASLFHQKHHTRNQAATPPRASTEQPLRTTANAYAQRLEARRERLEVAAARAEAESMAAYRNARKMAECIPFGQPILVGHHSEGRDRRFRDRIHNTFGKSFSLQEKADYLTRKAASVGTGGISGDDPDAITKLQKELDAAVENQAMMKSANRIVRSTRPEDRKDALIAAGFAEKIAERILTPDCYGKIGHAAWAFQNGNANIHRIEERIEELRKLRARQSIEMMGKGYTYREDVAENRIMILF